MQQVDNTLILCDGSLVNLYTNYCDFFPNYKGVWLKPRKRKIGKHKIPMEYWRFNWHEQDAINIFQKIDEQLKIDHVG